MSTSSGLIGFTKKEVVMALKKAGALWVKSGKKGKFFSLVIGEGEEESRYLGFQSNNKTSDKSPDWIIYIAEDEDGYSRKEQPTGDSPF
jgi:hypothetical protein